MEAIDICVSICLIPIIYVFVSGLWKGEGVLLISSFLLAIVLAAFRFFVYCFFDNNPDILVFAPCLFILILSITAACGEVACCVLIVVESILEDVQFVSTLVPFQPEPEPNKDVVGGFPYTIHKSWLSDTAVCLALNIQASRDYSICPILADALQDVGCEDEIILKLLRLGADDDCKGDLCEQEQEQVIGLIVTARDLIKIDAMKTDPRLSPPPAIRE